MKRMIGLAALGLVFVTAVSCDTEQPTAQGARTAGIQFVARAPVANMQDLWDRYRDLNNNGQLDSGEPFRGVLCEPIGLEVPEDAPVPWTFSVEISVIRAGTVTPILVTAPVARADFRSTTVDDQRVILGVTPELPAFDGFVHVNPRRVFDGNLTALAGCYGAVVEEANIAGEDSPFLVDLAPGDTIIVKAGKNPAPPVPIFGEEGLFFTGVITLDGRTIVPDGVIDTRDADGRLSFSYTVR